MLAKIESSELADTRLSNTDLALLGSDDGKSGLGARELRVLDDALGRMYGTRAGELLGDSKLEDIASRTGLPGLFLRTVIEVGFLESNNRMGQPMTTDEVYELTRVSPTVRVMRRAIRTVSGLIGMRPDVNIRQVRGAVLHKYINSSPYRKNNS